MMNVKLNKDKLKEECGVLGAYDLDGKNVASTVYYGLLALQHRGQESCGIAVSDTKGPKGKVISHKDMGLVKEAFTPERLETLQGDIGVGHVRYSTAGSSTRENAQPLCIGRRDNTYLLASESCALDIVGAEFVRDVFPGEIVSISQEKGIVSDMNHARKPEEHARCIFEYIYFSRPDSVIDGVSVYHSRIAAGKFLA